MRIVVRVLFDEQSFGVLPCAAAILLDVPIVVQTLSKNQRALRRVGDEPAEGEVGVVMDQHFADVEDDVTIWGMLGDILH